VSPSDYLFDRARASKTIKEILMGKRRIQSCLRLSFSICAFVLLCAASAMAQMPDKFTNLQVLPKDITKKELMSIMRGFSFSIGVRCEYCHVQKADKKIDFPLDDKEEKKTARLMLRMVEGVNRDYVSKIGKPSPVKVECVTCHHGLARPIPLNTLLAETIEKKGVAAAVDQYKELKTKYFGGGQYDFGETRLNILVEALTAQDKNKEAVAISELNIEENKPASMWSYHLLALSHEANGEHDKYAQDLRKVVELHPDDKWAKDELAKLDGAKK
jgi:hypothetical protein